MRKILASAWNTLLLLTRDRAGLLVLFVMPAVLVVVITLVQENILELSGQRETEIVLFDQDGGAFSKAIRVYLHNSHLKIRDWDANQEQRWSLREVIADGTYQAGIIIADGTSARIREETTLLFKETRGQSVPAATATASLAVLFDPAAMAGFRAGMLARLQMAAQAAEMELKVATLSQALSGEREGRFPGGNADSGLAAGMRDAFSRSLMTIEELPSVAGGATFTAMVNPVDQNVPAWALFGMFFTAIPIAGTILEERASGISLRLACMPVSPLQLLAGKVAAYLWVCICQFLLIILIGMYLFPHLGLPSFTLSTNAPLILPLLGACSLAACGFGIFLGSICRSYEQASTLGATSVVVAAALGGVMVPVYAMPQLMQKISVFSPLNWGVTAFSDLLVRGNPFAAIVDDLARLLIFAAVMVLVSWKRAYRRET